MPATVKTTKLDGKDEAPLDQDRLLELVSGDASLLRELVALAQRELPDITSALRVTIGSGDTRTVGSAAHQLKGALSNLGAGPALALARRMEEAAVAGDLQAVCENLAPLERAMADLQLALEQVG
jgi:HPt (histidine-containing phosphotransfer) domain-containing protein